MSFIRTEYYYMTPDQRREYHRRKDREYRERKAALQGRTIRPRDPNSHPSQMTYDQLLAYKREHLRRYKERQLKSTTNDHRTDEH